MIIGSLLLLILTTAYIVSFEGSFLIGGSSNLNKLKIDESIQLEQKEDTTDTDLINAKEIFSAYDSEQDLYYVSNKDIVVSHSIGTDLFMTYDEERNIYTLLAVKGNEQRKYQFVETKLPIMNIDSIIREQNDEETRSQVKVFDLDNEFSEHMLDYKLRGDSSLIYEKDSYSLKSIKNIPISMLGMPKNNKYVINSLYEDEYKVRDVLSWDICSQLKNSLVNTDDYICSDMVHIEVFLDNEYLGLYGLQEYINEFSLDMTNSSGTIYKARKTRVPGSEDKPIKNRWEYLDLVYNNRIYSNRWQAMEEYFDLLDIKDSQEFTNKSEKVLNLNNFKNHYIFTELLFDRDIKLNNTFFSQKNSEKIQITAWDLDQTFGMGWTGEKPFLTYTDYETNSHMYSLNNDLSWPVDKLIANHESFAVDAAKRYFEFRELFLTKDNLIDTSDKYHNLLRDTGAFDRDNERWPNGPKIPQGREYFISEFIDKRIDFLDKHFSKILAGEYDE